MFRPNTRFRFLVVELVLLPLLLAGRQATGEPISVSGVYPHLAYWNPHGECGTGAVVPWAGKLWVITYGPHFPHGSKDKLYSIDADLRMKTFAGSIGGTPANRMIHRETNQLVIGPYVIDDQGGIRVIPVADMPGRLTGTARHLFEPAKKVYYATMEEGVYSVDLESLAVAEHFRDDQGDAMWGGTQVGVVSSAREAGLPGYHGKGLYSGQGRLIYANNGEPTAKARKHPDIPSGCLAEWDGESDQWKVIRRDQFTDIRGPGGIYGNPNPDTDPVWAIGWDHRSLLLMLLDGGEWYTYRLPKASHTYDGAHGWNTEWPRFQDIGEEEILMNMHGMFWRFPRTFSRANSAGIMPRSTYLKVVGDYCRWGDKLVFGCDDTAKTEFLNQRKAKGKLGAPGMSHSNLWFTPPSILDELGPALGRGAVWMHDDVEPKTPSDPFLFNGFDRQSVMVRHGAAEDVTFTFEVDKQGDGTWKELARVTVPPNSSSRRAFDVSERGAWVRVSADRRSPDTSVQFYYANEDPRSDTPDAMFEGLADGYSQDLSVGIVRVRTGDNKTLGFAATSVKNGAASDPQFYELDAELNLRRVDNAEALTYTFDKYAIPEGVLEEDDASMIYVDDDGQRWRLPRGRVDISATGLIGPHRVDREVVTERDLFNCGGLFYELPARNAGGFSLIRPICTHNTGVHDYCSYRGLLVMSGVEAGAAAGEHILRSEDGQVALWAGVVDDLWKLGKPTGFGGPWLDTEVSAGVPSDPYLLTGFDHKAVSMSHDSDTVVAVTLQLEIDGAGTWVDYETYKTNPGETMDLQLPDDVAGYWIRAVADRDCRATVQLRYE